MNVNFDVAVIGAGPAGLAEACLLTLLNNKVKVCVLDGRENYTRTFGLSINANSIKRIESLIDQHLKTQCYTETNKKELLDFKKLVQDWTKFSSVKIDDIQKNLSQLANRLGVTILQGKPYQVTSENLSQIFDSHAASNLLSPELLKMRHALSQTKIIVGADGAHSTVRKTVMGSDEDNLVDQKTYGHMLELKYEVKSHLTKRPNTSLKHFNSVDFGDVCIQSIGKPSPEKPDSLPVTELIFVSKKVHKSFLEYRNREIIRGAPGKGWNFSELKSRSSNNSVVKKYFQIIKRQMRRTNWICGAKLNKLNYKFPYSISIDTLKVSTLPLKIYRSRESVKKFLDKTVVLVGDSNSGLILRQGYNLALAEVAQSTEAILKHLKTEKVNSGKVSDSLLDYQKSAQKTFTSKAWWIGQKIRLLSIIKFPLQHIINPIFSTLFNLWKKCISRLSFR